MRSFLVLFLAFALLVATHDANAQDAASSGVIEKSQSAPQGGASPSQSEWYGWQNIVAGAPGIALLAGARFGDSTALVIPGYVGAVLGSPIVHWAHGRVGTGFASAGLNVAAILILGTVIPSGCNRDLDAPPDSKLCQFDSRALVPNGAIVGAGVALALDAALLARRDVPVPARGFQVAPRVAAGRQGAFVELAGTF
jgi:hypothetical protein